MDSKDFAEYIKEDIGIENINKSDICILNFYINSVKEIEKINSELCEKNERSYFKKIMLPEDYVKILRDLRGARISKFLKLISEKEKYLKKLELPDDELKKTIRSYEKEYAKELGLKIGYDLHEKIFFK